MAMEQSINGKEIATNDIQYHINRGISYGQMGLYDQAISEFNIVIKIAPDNADAYNNRGLANQDKGNLDQALADYNKAIEIKPSHADA